MSEKNSKLIDWNGDTSDMKSVSEIAKMAQKILKEENNIVITMADAIPTIVYQYLIALAKYLEKNKVAGETTSINFMNYAHFGVTFRESEDGEKDGNFTPFVQPGSILKTLIKSDETTEDDEDSEE